jgi:hypothetical protein
MAEFTYPSSLKLKEAVDFARGSQSGKKVGLTNGTT